jgi:hypothetical protein
MGDKEEALFRQKVISIIRRCFLIYSPVLVVIFGGLGWWLTNMSVTVEANTKGLARVETKVDFLVEDVRNKK